MRSNIPLVNKAVLSNIYATERKQGHGRASIDTAVGGGCHMTQVREGTKAGRGKKKSSFVFTGSAYQRTAWGYFFFFFFFPPNEQQVTFHCF